MSLLEELAVSRAGSVLPPIPGQGYQQQLVNARQMAEDTLRRYVPNFAFDPEQAIVVSSQVEGWASRNEDYLTDVFADTAQHEVPKTLALELGANMFKQWIIASFTLAAVGMGPWQSGYLEKEVYDPVSDITEQWARNDGNIRLQMFQYILLLEEQGDLERAMNPQVQTSGFGVTGMEILLIVLIIAVLGCIIAGALLWNKQLANNNRIMADLCKKAQMEGNDEVVAQCVNSSKDLQTEGPFEPLMGEFRNIAIVLGGVAVGGFILFNWGLPWLTDYLGKKGRPIKKA